MIIGTHPLTVEGYRERTAADLRGIPITAHGYKCAVCKRAWNKGTAGRKRSFRRWLAVPGVRGYFQTGNNH
jgi:hypothetical protein